MLVSQEEAAACDLCPGVFGSRRAMRLHRQRCSQRAQLQGAAAQSNQQSAVEEGQRHDRQAAADRDASSGAAAVPVLPPIDPAILRELAARPPSSDSHVQMDEQGARADVSHGRSNRNGVTSSSTATGAAGCDGGGRGAEIASPVNYRLPSLTV